jgi:hypothetical protein
MSGEALLFINPKRGKGGRFVKRAKARRRRRHAARSHRRVARRRHRRSRPAGARTAVGYVVGSRPVRRRKLNPRRHRAHRRRRHNPMGGLSVRGVLNQLIPAAIGGTGAVGLNIGLAYLPIPDTLKTGPLAIATKVGGALLLGWGAGKLIGRHNGQLVTLGALTVVAYDVIRQLVAQAMPQLPGLADYEDMRLSAYQNSNLGYVNPASIVRNDTLAAYQEPSGHAMGDFGDGM